MNHITENTTTLIFDLGGVIVDLAPERTLEEFSKLAQQPVAAVFKQYAEHPIFQNFETGRIAEDEFRTTIRQIFNVSVTDAEIDRCWNAMLIDLPVKKLSMLTTLKNHFTTIVLSNTNTIHLRYISDVLLNGNSLDAYFHHAYYSHLMGMRKPDTEIYTFVLNKHHLQAEQTFFMDDNVDNIAAAARVGIQTLVIEHPDRVTDLFKIYA